MGLTRRPLLVFALACLCAHAVTAACPSPTFVDDAAAVPAAAIVPAATSITWAPGAPAPVTHATAHALVDIPLPTPPTESQLTQREACPFQALGLKLWHDPDTWGGAVPVAGADVTIPANTHVLVSSCSLEAAGYGAIDVPATSSLVFADAAIDLHARSITVSGALLAGSPSCRIRNAVSITLHGTRGDGGSKGIIVSGTIDMHGEWYTPTWTRLAATAAAGDTEVFLQDCVNWRPGQTVVVTTTQYKDSRNYNRNEERTISAVACVDVAGELLGRVTLSTALTYGHYAVAREYQAEVGLLSRTITVQGAADDSEPTNTSPSECSNDRYSAHPCDGTFLTGHGAQLKVVTGGVGRLSGVEFLRGGQTNVMGVYPIHFHLLSAGGADSYVEDCSVHRSYHRCIVSHGTDQLRLSRNVAYDAIGNCMYMESGNEELNVWEYNLVAHVHTIGAPMMFSADSGSQDADDVVGGPDLLVPADITAACYYVTNLYNYVRGNAAVGGWAGYSLPNLPGVIGPERNEDPSFVPMNRPTLEFDGNVARSSGYWWSNAGCMYVGGGLWHQSDADDTLVYNGGRMLGAKRKPVDATGADAWNVFTNTKLSLCGRSAVDWNTRSEWHHIELSDMRDHTFHVFGDVWLNDVHVTCRTGNTVETVGTLYWEKAFNKKQYKAFRSYDTGNRHILTNWEIERCNDMSDPEYPEARVWTLPAGVNMPQFQLLMGQVTYTEPVYEPARVCLEEVRMDRYGQYFMSIVDIDGSLTQRGVPTITGAHGGNKFWMLSDVEATSSAPCEERVDWHYPMWACDAGARATASFEMAYTTRNGVQNNWNIGSGSINHWGYAASRAAPIGLDPGVMGPYHHKHVGGWFISLDGGAPRVATFTRLQVPFGDTLMLALAYPSTATLEVRAQVTQFCTPEDGYLCDVALTDAGSIAAVRGGVGDTYHWDGTYLYLKLVSMARQTSGKRYLGTVDSGWTEVDGDTFTRGGFSIPDRGGSRYQLVVTATCDVSPTDDEFCAGAVAVDPPPACAPTEVQVAIDECTAAVEEVPGQLPIVIAVPHGGALTPPTIPDRAAGCYDAGTDACTYTHDCGTPDESECGVSVLKDTHTIAVAERMSDALFAATGRRPHLVINHVHRKKVDANREVGEATLGVPAAAAIYNEYHAAVGRAVAAVKASCGAGLLIDLHGQAHAEEWVELGYTVSGATLDASTTAAALDAVSPTSFDSLLSNPLTTNANSVSKLLRGANSLGTLLSDAFTTVPSAANPGPAGGNYFSGGYTTKLWGVAASAVSPDAAAIDAVQIELPRSIRFGGTPAHETWGAAAAQALSTFFTATYEISLADDAGCPAAAAECDAAAPLPTSYWIGGNVWDDICLPELHGACPPADPSRQVSYTPPGESPVTLTRRLEEAQAGMRRRDPRCDV